VGGRGVVRFGGGERPYTKTECGSPPLYIPLSPFIKGGRGVVVRGMAGAFLLDFCKLLITYHSLLNRQHQPEIPHEKFLG